MNNLAWQMNKKANDIRMSHFNNEIYQNILTQINNKAEQGDLSTYIYFHNCNHRYLEPYVKNLKKDGFYASAVYSGIEEDPLRMALHINWG